PWPHVQSASVEAGHRYEAYSGAPCSAAGSETPLGPHRNQRGEPDCDPDVPAFDPDDLSRADENRSESSAYGADAASHVDPSRTGATASAKHQGEGPAGGQVCSTAGG